jgi:predicted adenylyl cyclase CyaB
MARNVEIKARVAGPADLAAIEARVRPLADRGPESIAQDDTFFHCAHGRLKLRDFGNGRGELIAYARDDTQGPKTSTYVRTETADPVGLRDALARALGVRGRVRKQRTLYLVGATRVHLDTVQGLGTFMELEVVLRDDQPADEGTVIAQTLLSRLGIAQSQLVAGAYIDLLERTP